MQLAARTACSASPARSVPRAIRVVRPPRRTGDHTAPEQIAEAGRESLDHPQGPFCRLYRDPWQVLLAGRGEQTVGATLAVARADGCRANTFFTGVAVADRGKGGCDGPQGQARATALGRWLAEL